MEAAKLFTDGGSRSNPGHAASAAILFQDDKLISFDAKSFESATNNFAEYSGLIIGLKLAQKNNIKNIECYLDSELVVKQIKGEYKIKDENLKKLAATIQDLIKSFETFEIKHVRREDNKHADRLVNLIIDAYENH